MSPQHSHDFSTKDRSGLLSTYKSCQFGDPRAVMRGSGFCYGAMKVAQVGRDQPGGSMEPVILSPHLASLAPGLLILVIHEKRLLKAK